MSNEVLRKPAILSDAELHENSSRLIGRAKEILQKNAKVKSILTREGTFIDNATLEKDANALSLSFYRISAGEMLSMYAEETGNDGLHRSEEVYLLDWGKGVNSVRYVRWKLKSEKEHKESLVNVGNPTEENERKMKNIDWEAESAKREVDVADTQFAVEKVEEFLDKLPKYL